MNPLHILVDDRPAERNGGPTTGEKRNDLLKRADQEYIWFIDDDDEILPGGIQSVLKAMDGSDVIGIDGYITTNNLGRIDWEIRLGHPYKEDKKDGKPIYLRYPNHITPMRKECVKDLTFPVRSYAEDKAWADKILMNNRLKTQSIAEGFIYHYKYSTKDKLY